MVKKVLSIVVAVVVLFALCACNGNSDLIKKIDELESTVQSQADKITELEEKNKQQSDRVTELEEQNKQQADKIEDLIEDLELELSLLLAVYTKNYCPIETAYENGWLTRDDIMHISYFQYGVVIEGTLDDMSTWQEIEFEPTKKTPKLSERAKKAIRVAEANRYKDVYPDASPDSVYIYDYLGEYNGYAVMRLDYYIGDYPQEGIPIEFDGIILSYTGPKYRVYKLD